MRVDEGRGRGAGVLEWVGAGFFRGWVAEWINDVVAVCSLEAALS